MGDFLCGLEWVKRFVNVHLHCIVSNLNTMSEMSTLSPLEKFLRMPVPRTLHWFPHRHGHPQGVQNGHFPPCKFGLRTKIF